ncbi:MAG TPA: AAA family ATPase [Bacilli bacterium]|nr:AAA family ATPase [Bacilli bacterium]
MLKEIRFKNWKSFKDATLYIDPLTVLIGTNASGKSNVVDGLEFLYRVFNGMVVEEALNGTPTSPGIRGGAEWAARKQGNTFTIDVIVDGENQKEYVYRLTIQTEPNVIVLSESLISRNVEDDTVTNEIFTAELEEGSLSYVGAASDRSEEFSAASDKLILLAMRTYPFDKNFGDSRGDSGQLIVRTVIQAVKNIFVLDPIPSLMRGYSPASRILVKDASNLAGVMTALSNEEKNELETTLSHYVSQLPERDIQRVWAEPVGRLQKDSTLYCEEQLVTGDPPLIIDASGMSDGTLRFIGIITALLTRPEGSQLIIEEVDNGLHPSRAGLLLQMLREIGAKRNIDILVTTHNPALLDAMGPEMVPFVVVAHRSDESGESKLTLLEDIQNLPKLLASGPLGKIVTQGAVEKSLHEGEGKQS